MSESPEFMARVQPVFGAMQGVVVTQNGIMKANCQGCAMCEECAEYACRHTLMYKQSMPNGMLEAVLVCHSDYRSTFASSSTELHEGRLPE
jgi:hypothetical protein